MEKKYLIWSIEHEAWWAHAERGYTPIRDDAGKYGYEEATKIVKMANIGNYDVPNEAMIEVEE